ncbi:MAG: hypothetical protein WDW38_005069 [Sanguina aurantia]
MTEIIVETSTTVKTESVPESTKLEAREEQAGTSQDAAEAPTSGQAPESIKAEEEDPVDEEELLRIFFADLKDVDRDNEVNRILWAFKLNPFEKMDLRFDTSVEDVRRQYRKLSLAVHPDKCKHPQAAAAFDVLGSAQKELLDEEKRSELLRVLGLARDETRAERKKKTKHDTVLRVASLLHEEGRAGLEAEWEKTDDFHEKWKLKARETLAQSEWRKRKLGKRVKEETLQLETEEASTRENAKMARQAHKDWEESRETRVGSWHDFVKTKGGKKATGELKPPKLKCEDEDKRYVQRPVGEQFRPPPPTAPKPNYNAK